MKKHSDIDHQSVVNNLARYYTCWSVDIEDAKQEALLKLWKYQPDNYSFAIRIAKSAMIDQVRKMIKYHSTKKCVMLDITTDEYEDDRFVLCDLYEETQWLELFNNIPKFYHKIVLLRIQGQSIRQIAKVFKVYPSTIHYHLERLKKYLKEK